MPLNDSMRGKVTSDRIFYIAAMLLLATERASFALALEVRAHFPQQHFFLPLARTAHCQ